MTGWVRTLAAAWIALAGTAAAACETDAAGCAGPAAARQAVTLLTGSGFAPLADKGWPGGGMVTQLVQEAWAQSPDPLPATVRWRSDAGSHLKALTAQEADMGFPWPRPDCAAAGDDDARCTRLLYSDPVIEVVVLLFVRADREFAFEGDADLETRKLCHPRGSLPGNGPSQARGQDAIADTAGACFDLLMRGAVDAVAVNEFLGVQELFRMGLTADVVPLPRPLEIVPLHLVIAKNHWRATTHLYRFNAGLARLRASGRYAQVVSEQLAVFWDRAKR